MRILIIEDEQSNADRLKRMLEGEHEIVGVCASNAEVKAFFSDERHAQVDLILSDIQLGDGLSFESLKTVPTAIPVIFTTAYDHYAVQAFQFNSIDYRLKPIDSEELHAALAKVEKTFSSQLSTTDTITQLLASVKSQTIRYRERFLIPHRADEYLIVPCGRCEPHYNPRWCSSPMHSRRQDSRPEHDPRRSRKPTRSAALHACQPSVHRQCGRRQQTLHLFLGKDAHPRQCLP